MISVSSLRVEFGGEALFDDVSFLINQKDRVGLVGKNGAGKSTLLKILCGEYVPTSGQVSAFSGIHIGYLPQDMKHSSGRTVKDETSEAFKELRSIEVQLNKLNNEIAERTDYESQSYEDLIIKVSDLTERFTHLGGYTAEAEVEKILLGLGFERSDFTRLTDEFSGGWRMRIELAKILLQKPDVILLDEPTNHLDIESIQWLEDFLIVHPGAVVLVSHDKAFLDAVTNRTIEISLGKIYDYKTNYSHYLELRAERKEQQLSEQKNQDKYIQQTQQLIDKYRYKASKAAFAQSLIKKLDKLDRVEVDESDLSSIRFKFANFTPSGKVVFLAENLSKAYESKLILDKINFSVERGERISFVGRNGEGKSTLTKIIVNDLTYTGTLTPGHNVNIGYYAQNQAEYLDVEKTVFQTIDDVAVGDMRKQVRGLLGSFLFSGETVEKKVKVLSGGERARLALCKLLLFPYNVLVLDEPTNHLDIKSKDVLKQALLDYEGTLIIVSHDRDFLNGLTNKVYEFRNKIIKEFIGDVTAFLKSKKITNLSELEQKEKVKSVEKSEQTTKSDYHQKKESEKELRKIQNQIKKREEEISRLETIINQIDEDLLDPEKYKAIINDKDTFAKYENYKKQLDAEMQQWEGLNLSLEEFKSL